MSDDASAASFARIGDAFARAWDGATAARQESHYALMGARIRIRAAGRDLAHHIHEALAHARVDEVETTPALAVDLWDARATAVPGLDAAAHHAAGPSWRIGTGVFAASSNARFVSHTLGSSVVWLDRQAQRMIGWYADGNDVSLHQRGKPLQMLLALWASDRGLLAVHAACVSRDGVGVLIPGRSGSGKSTAALACVQAGFDYLGDDWIGIGAPTGGAVDGYGLYASTFFDPRHATRFPRIAPHLISPRDASEEKALCFLADVFPDQLRAQTSIRALALPRIVPGAAARLRPAAKRDAMLGLVPSSVFEMHPRAGRAGVDRLAQLVQQIPAYELEMGSEIAEIPRRVDEILTRLPHRTD